MVSKTDVKHDTKIKNAIYEGVFNQSFSLKYFIHIAKLKVINKFNN